MRGQAGQRIGLADKGLRHRINLLPGLGNLGSANGTLTEVVLAVSEGVAVAVDGDAVGFAIPGADGGLEVAHEVIGFDLGLNPIRHLVQQAFACGLPFEGCAHFDDVEVDGSGGDGLLQTRVIVGLCKVDPVDLSARVGFPWLEEAAEQQVVQVLVVQTHEGQFNAGKLALGDVRFGGAKAQLTNLLPIGIGRAAIAHARNRQNLGAHRILCHGRAIAHDARHSSHRAQSRRPLQHAATAEFGP